MTTGYRDEDLEILRQRLEMRERQIDAVHRVSAALFSKGDLDSILRETLHVGLEVMGAPVGSILLYDKDRRRLIFRYVVGKSALIGLEIDPEEDINGKAATAFRTGKSLLTINTRTESYNARFDRAMGFHTESIMTIPLKIMGGETIGVMQALNKAGSEFSEDDQELMEIVGSLAATSIMNFRLAEEAKLAAVARAMGDLGHDIKNSLTPVETTVSTTLDAFVFPLFEDIENIDLNESASVEECHERVLSLMEPLREWIPEMQQAMADGCGDIREMVSEIADYIKGAQATNMQRRDIGLVIQEKLRRLRVVAQNRRVTLHIEGLTEAPYFPFDSRLVGRAISNLIHNALNAIKDAVMKGELDFRREGYNIWLKLSTNQEGEFPVGNYCLLEVQDDGPGIPDVVLESLFTPHTISTTIGGTGIGTRFIKSVADSHGGEVGVVSERGKGARFWLKLPLEQEITIR